jgi:hypothetical protein
VFLNRDHRLGNTPVVLERPEMTRVDLLLVKEGYSPRRASVLVEGTRGQRVQVQLTRNQGTLVVTGGFIKGAEIAVDGQHVGITPSRVQVDADAEHTLEVTKSGYVPYRERVSVKSGESREVVALLEPAGRKLHAAGFLEVAADCPASVYLDGSLYGVAPLNKVPVGTGTHLLLVKSVDGKTSKSQKVTVKRGEVTTVEVRLGP